jgi:lysophospholipase L1-like esterase
MTIEGGWPTTYTVLCYGDSNTWGYDPRTAESYPSEARWPEVLGRAMGDGYRVTAEGLNGRTTEWDDPLEGGPDKNGARYLSPCLGSHRPLDMENIMPGTYDLQHRFSASAFDIANGVGVLVDLVPSSEAGFAGQVSAVLVITLPPLAWLSASADMFRGGTDKSRR